MKEAIELLIDVAMMNCSMREKKILDRLVPHVRKLPQLIDESRVLDALRAGGVDNWEWFSDSLSDNYEEFDGKLPETNDPEV
jgi:hypothetical protein